MKILVVGLSKTGTTALYSLINDALSASYDRLFEPKIYTPNQNENVLCKVLLGPRLDLPSFAAFDKRITIVRDIRDRLISLLLYQQFHASYLKDKLSVKRVFECLVEKETSPCSVSLLSILGVISDAANDKELTERFFKRIAAAMNEFDNYVNTYNSGLVYRYEQLVQSDFAPLECHLGIALPERINVPKTYNRVIRTKGYGSWRDWFTPTDVDYIKPLVSTWLSRYDYDVNDWELNDTPSIAPEHCSVYFERLVQEVNRKS